MQIQPTQISPSLEVVLVNGAASGVGRATALQFARRRARIGLLDHAGVSLDSLQRQIQKWGGEAIALPADIKDLNAVGSAANALEEAFGPIDIWVNAALPSGKSKSAGELRRKQETAYWAAAHGTLIAMQHMLPRNYGRIIQVLSPQTPMEDFLDSVDEKWPESSRVKVCKVRLSGTSHMRPEVAARAIYWAAHRNRRDLEVGLPSAVLALMDHFSAYGRMGLGFLAAGAGFLARRRQRPTAQRPEPTLR